MKTMKTKFTLTAMAVAFAGMSSLFADTVFYSDGAFYNGADGFANGTYVEDSTTITYGGLDTLEITLEGSYKSGGIDFYSGAVTTTLGETILQMDVYIDTVSSNWLNGITANFNTGSFNQGTDTWTIDGNPGVLGDLTGGAWHTIAIDLTSVSGFVSGTSQHTGIFTIKNNTNTDKFYIGDIRTTTAIPEPSSVVLLIVAGGTLLFFRRKK